MFAGNFAPSGWALCNGQLLSISANSALFAILGTFYGGNGVTTFALPDLQSRVPIHMGAGISRSPHYIGEGGGVESVVLSSDQLPVHTHQVNAVASGGNQAGPGNGFPAIESTGTSLNYSAGPANATMNAAALSSAGGTTPVPVMQPYLCVNFIIALVGIFPSQG